MPKQSETGPPRLRARQIPHAIAFLRQLGVPATRIAGVMGETADNIRHIDNRAEIGASVPTPIPLEREDLALVRLSAEERAAQLRRNLQGIRIRTKQDFIQTEALVWNIIRTHQSVAMQEGYDSLVAILPSVANARHAQALRVRLLIEEKLAWFALPLAQIAAALAHSTTAMSLAFDAFKESAGDRGYLLRYGEAALIAAICHQKLHRPKRALMYIKAADTANLAAGQLPGSEHLRQRGASFLMMGPGYDEQAKRALGKARERMKRKDEARQSVDLDMNSLRQSAFLNPVAEWDDVQTLVQKVSVTYGEKSMQYAVAAKSAAAAGLKLSTPATNAAALKLLDTIVPVPSYALSKGVPHILSMTPDLGLNHEQLDLWLRFALFETPASR